MAVLKMAVRKVRETLAPESRENSQAGLSGCSTSPRSPKMIGDCIKQFFLGQVARVEGLLLPKLIQALNNLLLERNKIAGVVGGLALIILPAASSEPDQADALEGLDI